MSATPTVAFVVPAWNEEELLPRALSSIHEAARALGLEYEVVVADDASSDATADVARAHGARVVACDHRQIAATRNAGARASSGDVLVFVDADTAIGAASLREALDGLARGGCYGGSSVTWDGRIPLWSRVVLRAILVGYRLLGTSSGAFLFCTREAFERAGGFDESLFAAEEYDLTRRLGKLGSFVWVRSPVVTSGRKLRAYSAGELLSACLRLGLRGRKGLASRDGLDLWYGERRRERGER